MKNTKNKSVKMRSILAITLTAVMVITAASCSKSSGGNSGSGSSGSSGDDGKSLNSAKDLKAYLDKQPFDGPDKPIKIAMKLNETMFKEIRDVIKEAGKYVSLDLSGSPITTIPDYAFYDKGKGVDCKPLAGIIIPNSVTYIGDVAFKDTSLTSVNIPNSVTSIGEMAFIGCTRLTSVTIPNSVTRIGSEAFSGCRSLTSVTIPDSVTTIGEMAFSGCAILTSVNIPNSVTSIGNEAFARCPNLTSVTFETGSNIPNDKFGDNVFPELRYGDHGGGNTLKYAYRTGRAGTYTRTAPISDTWTKQ